MPGVSTTGSNSLGTALVVGRKRVPNPAAGTIAVWKALMKCEGNGVREVIRDDVR
ncbi:hypothetical protein GCM10009634_01280 [Saccharothrix xinjiangensis]